MPSPTFSNLPEEKRARIIDAAIEEFATRPYAQATLDRIVAGAGISKGSMYQYFEGKADLYRWLIGEHLTQERLDTVAPVLAAEDLSVWDLLEQMFLAGLRAAATTPRLTRLRVRFFRDQAVEPELASLYAALRDQTHVWMIGLLETGRVRGDIRDDVDLDLLAQLLAHAMGEGMLTHLARRLEVSLDELLDSPAKLQSMSDDAIVRAVRAATQMFRDGAGGAR